MPLLDTYRAGFDLGLTHITRFDDSAEVTTIGVAVLKLAPTQTYVLTLENEMALLVMQGKLTADVDGTAYVFERHSLFDEQPSCIHAAKGVRVELRAETEVEFTLYQCENEKTFPTEVYLPDGGKDEHRGKGQVGDTCLRFVRTIFDDNNSHRNAELVLGEVITMPGKWSSYPPHSHPQPEIYHYRFTDPRGWGHAELGEDVMKVRPNDTVRIVDNKTHAQVAAPGYGMYYAWIIRHLPDDRYSIPKFEEQHQWIMDPDATYWQPKE
ncbi:5-deoxy-glucuronate isomerase [Paremcibacter congregatus]|uniref:5-deoxyglucuronate isomerase n=1 Tax=Paremcibacter congregatus TaxID=2043170 RepID=A0A2G4YYL4_9PROT|nr:5-deoxy-glucuronate isomerase [Paremcibacter congregatus]PHZ86536.1 5-deoxyglucuronate isomerase [Paremcibacter congregatus]QDE26340.1 5-deoxy-glucuronate isomerase [Paremcibacter congregatus]